MLRKIPFETSAEVLTRFELSEAGAAVVLHDMSPGDAIAALDQAGELPDLANFIAHGLPPREGICWALAVTIDLSPDLAGDITAMVTAWIREPQEGTRQKLMKCMDALTSETPLYWLSAAVAWNGSGGIGAADGPVVLPPAGLHAKALLAVIALQMGQDETQLDQARTATLKRGHEVANGGWPGISETPN